MNIRSLRLLDIREGDEEKIVQEVLNSKVRAAPPEVVLNFGTDPTDIKTAEQEAAMQAVVDERRAEAQARLAGGDMSDTPAQDAPAPEVPAADPAPEVPVVDPVPEAPASEVPAVEPAPEAPVPEAPAADPTPETPIVEEPASAPEEPVVDPAPDAPAPEATPEASLKFCDFCDSAGVKHKKACTRPGKVA